MITKWNYPDNAIQAINIIAAGQRTSKDGQIKFSGQKTIDAFSILGTLVNFHDEVPHDVQRRIVHDAIRVTAEKKRLIQGAVIQQIDRGQEEYLAQDKKEFILLSQISIVYSQLLKTIKRDEVSIRFSKEIPPKFNRGHAEEQIQNLINEQTPDKYPYVKTHVKARCEHSAAEKALNSLNILRGKWNLQINSSSSRRDSSGKAKPINKIIFGPLHTLHIPSGELATDIFWWEPSYFFIKPMNNSHKIFESIISFEKEATLLIKKTNYSESLNSALARYVEALDESNMNSAFLKLWSVLEFVTATNGINSNHRDTIKRASFIFIDKAWHSLLLEALRIERNKMVHEGSNSKMSEQVVYQLKIYVEEIIKFMMGEKNKFKSIEEFGSFLDLSTNVDNLTEKENELDRDIYKIRYAKKLFSK